MDFSLIIRRLKKHLTKSSDSLFSAMKQVKQKKTFRHMTEGFVFS